MLECSDKEFQKLLDSRFGGSRSRDSPKLTRFKSSRYNNKVNNYCNIAKYRLSDGSEAFKLVYKGCNTLKGLEANTEDEKHHRKEKKEYVNEEKLDASVLRAKRKIFDLAMCNFWQFFFTGTLDGKKYDRSDLKIFHKDLSNYIRNQNRLHGLNIKYLFIPELHSDGKSWHIHGFISGLPDSQLKAFSNSEHLPYAILNRLNDGIPVYRWLNYEKKFGFCDLEPIQDLLGVSAYCTKYITKDVLKSVKEVGAHTYFHSRGLNFPESLFAGTVNDLELLEIFGKINWDASNDYCSICWIDKKLVDFIKEKGTNLYE